MRSGRVIIVDGASRCDNALKLAGKARVVICIEWRLLPCDVLTLRDTMMLGVGLWAR